MLEAGWAMVMLDLAYREVTLKLVYYGPALSGKTTNLQRLHHRLGDAAESELLELDTASDRTLFFDLLPVSLEQGDFMIRLKLFTVPGQVMHRITRQMVLRGVDGVVFVADSQIDATRSNNESFADLQRNLSENGISTQDVPVVIQFNKRDLPNVRSDDELDRIAARGTEPTYRAVALRDEGVAETFIGAVVATWRRLDERYRLRERLGLQLQPFESHLRGLLGCEQ